MDRLKKKGRILPEKAGVGEPHPGSEYDYSSHIHEWIRENKALFYLAPFLKEKNRLKVFFLNLKTDTDLYSHRLDMKFDDNNYSS